MPSLDPNHTVIIGTEGGVIQWILGPPTVKFVQIDFDEEPTDQVSGPFDPDGNICSLSPDVVKLLHESGIDLP